MVQTKISCNIKFFILRKAIVHMISTLEWSQFVPITGVKMRFFHCGSMDDWWESSCLTGLNNLVIGAFGHNCTICLHFMIIGS